MDLKRWSEQTMLGFLLVLHISVLHGQQAGERPQSDGETERVRVEYTIVEEVPPNTKILDIGRNSGMLERYGREVYDQLQFSFLRQSDLVHDYFTIDSRGILSSRRRIDRESLCEHKAPLCVVEFDVAVRPIPIHFLEVITVRIIIRDTNDNAPEFPKQDIEFTISENVMPGVSFVVPTARDPDSGSFGIQKYEFFAGPDTGETFQLKVTNSTDGTVDLRLILQRKLDREERRFYTMRVVASDGGSPPKSGTVLINVTVSDANDNSPKFEKSSYEIRINEDIAPGTIILRVRATDPDEGANGLVTYKLSSDSSADISDLFAIRNNTGDILVIGNLDYERDRMYNLLVTAIDLGPDAVPTHARVVVRVNDINDHSPIISVNPLTKSGRSEVPENAETGHFVAHISVEDNDAGRNGEVICTLNDDHFSIERIYRNEYKIMTSRSFDREHKTLYRIILDCSDQGTYPRRSTAEIDVVVLDANDNQPVFTQEVYSVSMRENNSINVAILRVNATDLDSGPNGQIEYSVSEDARGLVKVDPVTGIIRANVAFDYEQMHDFRFDVIAHDRGSPARSVTATVVINLMDINDEAPTFSRDEFNFASFENQPVGTEIGVVGARDPDGPPYNRVTYSIVSSEDILDVFQIDSITGKITTRRLLDRENRPSYSFIVQAGNPGFPLTSTASVSVHVADVNDNAPLILFPNKENKSVQMPYGAPPGYVITRVDARDADFGGNGKLFYNIAKGNTEGLFDIDALNGAVRVAREGIGESENFYLLIEVKDNGKPHKSAVSDLDIFVNKTWPYKHGKAMGHAYSPFGIPTHNQTIVISLAAATVFLIIVLVTAIVLIKKKQSRGKREEYRYMCQVDLAAQRTASGKDSQDSEAGDTPDCLRTSHPPPCHNDDGRLKKEVRFSVEDVNSDSENRKVSHWRQDGSTETQVPGVQAERETLLETTFDLDGLHYTEPRHMTLPHEVESNALARHRILCDPMAAPWTLTQQELEVHQLLHAAMRDPSADSDSTSGCSADMSNTDSGRGPSEDGDHHHPPNDSQLPPPYEALWVQREPIKEEEEGSSGGSPREGGSRNPVDPALRPTPAPPRPPLNYRAQKYPMHRKVLCNNQLAPPGGRRQVTAVNKKPTPYNLSKVPMPHRLVDPRDHESGVNHAFHNNDDMASATLPRGDGTFPNKTVPPVCGTATLPYMTVSNSNSVANKPAEGHYCNTFGQKFPLRQLGRSEEGHGDLSDDSGTTTSGSYDIDHAGDKHRVHGITHMDTVV